MSDIEPPFVKFELKLDHSDKTRQVEWTPITLTSPPDGVIVNTIISDEYGVRNESFLRRSGNLWFFPDHSMYVYYTPTHWKDMT